MKSLAIRHNDLPTWLTDSVVALGAAQLIALCSQIAIPLPFGLVPFTLQAVGVLSVAAALGPRRGFFAVCGFLLEGLCGLPVFALGSSGLTPLLGPTGGYLMSYLPVSYLVGYLFAKGAGERIWSSLTAFWCGYLVLFMGGALWLSGFVGLDGALAMGVYPFLVSDFLVKTALLVCASPLIQRLRRWID